LKELSEIHQEIYLKEGKSFSEYVNENTKIIKGALVESLVIVVCFIIEYFVLSVFLRNKGLF
jgi:hypothetical protein